MTRRFALGRPYAVDLKLDAVAQAPWARSRVTGLAARQAQVDSAGSTRNAPQLTTLASILLAGGVGGGLMAGAVGERIGAGELGT